MRNKAVPTQAVGCSTCSLSCHNPNWDHAQALIRETDADRRVMLIFSVLLIALLGVVGLLEQSRVGHLMSLLVVTGLLVIPAGLLKLKSIFGRTLPEIFFRGWN